jgi:hypothetical protein
MRPYRNTDYFLTSKTSSILPALTPVHLGNLVTSLFCAQPEHAIVNSRPAGTAKNYYRPGDAERPFAQASNLDQIAEFSIDNIAMSWGNL